MTLNKDIYCEIVKHVNDLSDVRQLGLANKTLAQICSQHLEQYPALKTLAAYFLRGPIKYHQTALHILKHGNSKGKYKDEDDYLAKLKRVAQEKEKRGYFELPISQLVKYLISLWFIHRHLFIRLPPVDILKQYLEETQIFGNEYVALFKYQTIPKDPHWYCGTDVVQGDDVFCFNIHTDEFLCGSWDGEWPPHFQLCDECDSKGTSVCGKCGYYYIDFSEDDESDDDYDDDYITIEERFTQVRIKEGINTTGSGYYVGDFDAAFRVFMGVRLS